MYSSKEVGKAFRTILKRLKEADFETENNELLFVEGRGKDEIEIRLTSVLSLSSTLSLMESSSIEVSLKADSNTYSLDSDLFISSLENTKDYLL